MVGIPALIMRARLVVMSMVLQATRRKHPNAYIFPEYPLIPHKISQVAFLISVGCVLP